MRNPKKKSDKRRTREVRRRRSNLYLVMVLVGIFVMVLGYQGVSLNNDIAQLTAKETELKEKKKALEDEKKEIEEKSAYMQTDQYIEDIAREKFGLVYDDEIIFKAIDK